MTRTTNMLLTAAALAVVLAACSTTSGTGKPSAPTDANAFVLREWSVSPPTVRLQSGKVQITTTNLGSETHELVIVRASDLASLPLKSDGSVDEDKVREADKAGEFPDLAAGKSATKTLDLSAGSYVAFCNLVDQMGQSTGGMGNGGMGSSGMGSSGSGMGHVHYRLGMVTQFTVA